MLTRRIVPRLDVDSGRVVNGVRFRGLRDAGDPVELGRAYARAGADKVAVNNAAVRQPKLLSEAADRFGSQAVVIAAWRWAKFWASCSTSSRIGRVLLSAVGVTPEQVWAVLLGTRR